MFILNPSVFVVSEATLVIYQLFLVRKLGKSLIHNRVKSAHISRQTSAMNKADLNKPKAAETTRKLKSFTEKITKKDKESYRNDKQD